MKNLRIKTYVGLLLILIPLLANSNINVEDIAIYEPIKNNWQNPYLYILKGDSIGKLCKHGTFSLYFSMGGLEIVGLWSEHGDTLTMTQHMEIWLMHDGVDTVELPDSINPNRRISQSYIIRDSLLINTRDSTICLIKRN